MFSISLISMLLCIGVILLYSCGAHTPHLFISQINTFATKKDSTYNKAMVNEKNNRGNPKIWTHVEEPLHHRRRVYKSQEKKEKSVTKWKPETKRSGETCDLTEKTQRRRLSTPSKEIYQESFMNCSCNSSLISFSCLFVMGN
jgi:hypothetical protein